MRRTTTAAVGMLFYAVVIHLQATTITVTNTNDSGPGSLRQALADANDGDLINFAVTGTILLTSGGLVIDKEVIISGPGSNQLSIDGNHASYVFGVEKTAAISDLTIRNAGYGVQNYGSVTVNGCVLNGNCLGLYSYEAGSTISNCVVTGNSCGGVFNDSYHGPHTPVAGPGAGSMTIADTIISDNSGTGVVNIWFVTIINSTLSGNSTDYDGGALSTGTFKTPGTATVINSTISGNSASGSGGGIATNYSGLDVINSTISGNSAADVGGGIVSSHAGVRLANSTVSGNSAASCGGVCGGVEIGNTILNANAAGNIDGPVISHGYNISSDDGGGYLTGPGDQINTDPLLGPLQDNGGPTLTHALLPGSPAIDAGDPNFTPPPDYDQRGPYFVRVFHGRIDIGSFELQPRPSPAPRSRPTPMPRPTR
jgi:hypothetical protein